MEYKLEDTVALLTRTPAALDALLRGLPEIWIRGKEGEGSWSPFDVVAHLIHTERENWIPRARLILDFGETKAFEPFDREGNFRESQGKTLEQLLDEFARLRAESLQALSAMNLLPRGPRKKGAASGPGGGDSIAASGHLGGARPHPPAPDLARDGRSIPGGCGVMEQVPGSDAVFGSQCLSARISEQCRKALERIDDLTRSAAIHRWTAPLRIALAPIPCKVLPQTEADRHT